MDLDAIQLAWFKIIQFLDNNSRLHCRLLSRMIKENVDYMGLNLRVNNLNVLGSADKESWENFLKTPEIFFGKVHISAKGSEPVDLCLSVQHQVKHLEISGFLSLGWFVNVNWIQNIVKLSFHDFGLSTRVFGSLENYDVIRLQCLRKLYLSSSINFRCPEEYADEDRSTLAHNAATLLRKVRSGCLDSIFVELKFGGLHDSAELYGALAQSIQAHSQTLQTLVYFNSCAREAADLALVELSTVPHGLKNLELDFVRYCVPDSPWLNMLMELNHLKQFTCKAEPGHTFSQPKYLDIDVTKTILQKNFGTLKYLDLSIAASDQGTVLELLGCCSQMEYLRLNTRVGKNFKNLGKLPTSLKVIKIFWCDDEAKFDPSIVMDTEDVERIQKFKNLVEFTISPIDLKFPNHRLVLKFSKALLRLPKLDFLDIGEMIVEEAKEDSADYFELCQDFFKNLCRDVVPVNRRKSDEPVMQISLLCQAHGSDCDSEMSSLRFMESQESHKGVQEEFISTVHRANFAGVYGSVSIAANILHEMNCPTYKKLQPLPTVDQTRFRKYTGSLPETNWV